MTKIKEMLDDKVMSENLGVGALVLSMGLGLVGGGMIAAHQSVVYDLLQGFGTLSCAAEIISKIGITFSGGVVGVAGIGLPVNYFLERRYYG